LRGKFIEGLKALSVVFLSVCLFLFIAEVCLRGVDFPPEPVFGWKWRNSPYKSEANLLDTRVNELELRGRPINYEKDDFVIVLLGDSYTEAGSQPFEDMPEQILERLLRDKYHYEHVRVFSVASAGWGQDQQLIWLLNYFSRFRADLVLMWLTPINDYWENGNVDRSVTPIAGPLKPTFKPSANDLELAYPRSHTKIRLLLERAIARVQYGREAGIEQFYTNRWLESLPASNLSPVSSSTCPETEVDQYQLVSALQKGQTLTAVTDENLSEGRSHFSHFLYPHSLREAYQIEITHRLIERAKSFSEARGASFRAFYPKASDIDKALGLVKCVREKATGNYYASDFSDVTADLSSGALRESLLPIDIGSDEPTVISARDWHLNRAGNLLAMDGVARQLIHKNLLYRRNN
jgi:hypothetical protein